MGIFRKRSEDRLTSPDQLDQLVRVVRPLNWLPLLTLGGLLVAAVVWGFLGSVPETVEGSAILVHPSKVVSFQSPSEGLLASLVVEVGESVKKGQILGRLDLPDLQQRLAQARERLDLVRGRDEKMARLELDQAEKEKSFITSQCTLLDQRIGNIRKRADSLLKQHLSHAKGQRANLENARTLSDEMRTTNEGMLRQYRAKGHEKAVSQREIVDTTQKLIETKLRIAELQVKHEEVRLLEIQAHESYDKEMDRIEDLRGRRQQLELEAVEIDRRLLDYRHTTSTRKEELQYDIRRLQTLVDSQGVIRSEYEGTVLEVAVSPGSMIEKGRRLGNLEMADPGRKLMAVAYFHVPDGKKITRDMEVLVSPSTVQRARHGSIRGEVFYVSDYLVSVDAAANRVGNRSMAESLIAGGNQIEVRAILIPDDATPTGYEWTTGEGPDDITLSAGTTATVRVTLKTRPPITYVIPAFKSWLGIE